MIIVSIKRLRYLCLNLKSLVISNHFQPHYRDLCPFASGCHFKNEPYKNVQLKIWKIKFSMKVPFLDHVVELVMRNESLEMQVESMVGDSGTFCYDGSQGKG